jgi:hypothetical protein
MSKFRHCNIYFQYDFVCSLKMVFIVETCRRLIITEKFVYRLDLYFLFTSKINIIRMYAIPCRGMHCKSSA